MEESKSQIELSLEGVSPMGFDPNYAKKLQSNVYAENLNLEKASVVSSEIIDM